MDRLIFDSEHILFRDTVRHFMLTNVAPHAERWRRDGMVDRAVYRQAGEAGLLCLWAQADVGGAGIADLRFDQIIIEENIRHGETGFYIHLHSNLVAPYIDRLGSPTLRARLMPGIVAGDTILAIAMTEPGGGSDLRAVQTRAIRDGDGWRLSGTKTYISNGILSDAIVVVARCRDLPGEPIGLFLVERDMAGLSRGKPLKKMGLASQDTAEIMLDDVHVPADNLLGDPTAGFGTLMRFLGTERLIAAIASIAAAQVALDLTLDFVRHRRAFGQAIGQFQHNRFRLAALRAQIDAVQAMVDQLVLRANAGSLEGGDAASAKLLASEVESQMVDLGVQLHGGAGYMDEYRISRLYTDARISRIFAGSNEIMLEIIARGMDLDTRS
ncbi:acyl-CoA dehydrogenase family protein [Sphingobium limneticum]|uniref:Acyl-CoA dehydrogenase n=1 Tax=Sphingobium limneticum TaxID=1007511 RepID=A0A5J5I8T9_9SPHN|nr:acyl-CoA dehydrogenase family protein [Sphingobium limneticum]KAA9018238.1 acyl-CoA dehydrogenase [Sphingobium limneticum]KAA9030874.1 acyl-CoA dehydrogenase [Sphingobium limneticum]